MYGLMVWVVIWCLDFKWLVVVVLGEVGVVMVVLKRVMVDIKVN